MSIKVLKFGGSSLANAAQFRKAAAIIQAEPERRYVVASAPGKRFPEDTKVTDRLYRCYTLAAQQQDIEPVFAEIQEIYQQIIRELGIELSLDREFAKIRSALENHAGKDYIASRGEYLNAIVLANYLSYPFIDAAGVIFFSQDGSLDEERTYTTLADRLAQTEHAVIPGFYGSMPNGTIKTFSRGGSDITGAIVARAIHADLYENWTDVSGMLTADPRLVENPKVIAELTYEELRELSYMGATVLHDEAVFPVREVGIPLNIRNTNAPDDHGTMISPNVGPVPDGQVITGIAGSTGFSAITVEKDRMNGEIGFGWKLLGVLQDFHVPFEHIPTGIDVMTIVVRTNDLNQHREELLRKMQQAADTNTIKAEDGIALLAVAGRGMIDVKGNAGRILTTVAKQNINIRMIDMGLCESNIIIAVNEEDYPTAVRAIYREYMGG